MEGSPIPSSPHNLPVQLIPIVGREKEIGDLIGLLKNPDIGLITLHGFGGTGKTRLAVEVGRAALEMFPDGVWFVPLAPLNSPDYIFTAAASAMSFTFQTHEDQKSQFLRFLSGKNLLIIFDNLEHLLPASAAYFEEILQSVPEVRLLVTSRHPINAPWERVYPLHGLDYQVTPSVADKEIPAAVQLFLQHLSRAGAPASDNDLACAAQICHVVRGLPLALLLAASWGRALGCDDIFHEIRRGIGFLHAWQQTFPEKHSSMQAVFEYSWRLLSPQKQGVLRKLAVFRGGFDRSVAAEVAGAHLPLLADLVDQSLIERVSNDRYQIHELLREYLKERLVEAGEEKSAGDKHLAYYTHLAKQAEPELVGERLDMWITRFTVDMDNIRAALDWSLRNHEVISIELGLQLMTSFGRIWQLYNFLKEGLSFLTRFLTEPPEGLGKRLYAEGLNLAAELALRIRDYTEARRLANEVLRLGQELDDARLVGDAYRRLSGDARRWDDFANARIFAQQALDNYQKINDALRTALALEILGDSENRASNFAAAYTHLAGALEIARNLKDAISLVSILQSLVTLASADPQIGLQRGRAWAEEGLKYARKYNDIYKIQSFLGGLGEMLRLAGQHEEASRIIEEALQTINEVTPKEELIFLWLNLGFVYSRIGKHDSSKEIFLKSLAELQKFDHLVIEWFLCLLGLAGVAISEGKAPLAARILGTLETHKEQIILWPADKNEYERILSSVKAQLSEKQFSQLHREGQTLSLKEAAQLILDQGTKEQSRDPGRLNQLTKREIEILRLVAQGLSDAQVAERLVLSPRTVNAHLTSIYQKLGVNSRAAATRFAVEHGLA
jgi:predicted ATPase/DNA-binding CsgD family transcriptional regulator